MLKRRLTLKGTVRCTFGGLYHYIFLFKVLIDQLSYFRINGDITPGRQTGRYLGRVILRDDFGLRWVLRLTWTIILILLALISTGVIIRIGIGVAST